MSFISKQALLEYYISTFSLAKSLNQDLLNCLSIHYFQADQSIYKAQTEQIHLYFLVSGKAQVSYYLSNGKRSIVAMITPFSVIGDMELLENSILQLDVITTQACTLLAIKRSDVLRYGYDDPHFLRFIIESMGQKLRGSGYKQLSYDLPLKNRLAIYLIGKFHAETTIQVENKTIIADLIGTSPRHLNRIIKKLEDESIIQWQRNSVNILNVSKLQAFAEI